MYNVKKTTYGFRLTVGVGFNKDEMGLFLADVALMRTEFGEDFSGFIDARVMIAIDNETKNALKKLEEAIRNMGCNRFAVILKSPVVLAQLKQVAFDSGISKCERYIDAAKNDNWEQLGLDWAVKAIEPIENITGPVKQPQAK